MMNLENNLRSEIAANSSRPPRRRRAEALPAERFEFEQWDFHHLSQRAGRLFGSAALVAGIYALGGTAYLTASHTANAGAFAIVSVAGWLCLEFWQRVGRRGVPNFAVLAATLTLLNSLPLLTSNEALEGLAGSTIMVSALTVALFLMVLCAGWWLGLRAVHSKPSRLNLLPAGKLLAGGAGLALSLPLLGLAALYQMGLISGLLYRVLPGSLAGLMPILSAFSGAAVLLGAFLGGLAVAREPFSGSSMVFWLLFALAFVLLTASILLSSASGLVIACAMGLGFRRRRIPWEFMAVMLALVGFLNQGKFVMRDRYWSQTSGQASLTLNQLPGFYADWAETSVAAMANNWWTDASLPNLNEKEGQSMVERLDNFRNLTFIVDILQRQTMTPIYGKSYTLIPSLLIPRYFWPDKPRTHEGQILLNLHYGRQNDVEETYNTYVAWGLLPEAVGNFGCVGGAIFLGLLAGFICGWLETWSARKQLLSVEGLVAFALLAQLAVSYEMVASVLVTATFQMLVAVVIFGLLLRFWFNGAPTPSASRRARHRAEQLEELKAERGGDTIGNTETLKR